jgi:hypothetical protein
VNPPRIKNFIATSFPFWLASAFPSGTNIYDISLKNTMKNGIAAPPAIAAKLPTIIKNLSVASENLNNDRNETG